MKPVIGIVSRSSKDSEENSLLYVNDKVVEAVVKCGGIPFLILPTQGIDYESDRPSNLVRMTDENKRDLDIMLEKCDGIIMPGGSKWYEYDEYISKYSIDRNKPLLGICAGMQLLSKTLNNNEIDGIDNTILNDTGIEHNQPKIKYVHKINIDKNTYLYRILGTDEIEVNSRHRYHIPNELSFLASAYSNDGIIEAVEYKENDFVIGVQWHPETMIDYDVNSKKIIEEFISKCKIKNN